MALLDAVAIQIEQAQIILRFGEALVGGFPEPFGGFRPFRRRAIDAGVEQAEIILGLRVAAGCGFFQPLRARVGIGISKRTIKVKHGERELRAGMVFLGCLGEPGDSFLEIRFHAIPQLVERAHHGHGAGIAVHWPGVRQFRGRI